MFNSKLLVYQRDPEGIPRFLVSNITEVDPKALALRKVLEPAEDATPSTDLAEWERTLEHGSTWEKGLYSNVYICSFIYIYIFMCMKSNGHGLMSLEPIWNHFFAYQGLKCFCWPKIPRWHFYPYTVHHTPLMNIIYIYVYEFTTPSSDTLNFAARKKRNVGAKLLDWVRACLATSSSDSNNPICLRLATLPISSNNKNKEPQDSTDSMWLNMAQS